MDKRPSWNSLASSIAKYSLPALILTGCFLLMTYLVFTFLPVNVDWKPNGPFQIGVDWKGAFRPASLYLLSGKSPYLATYFFNPPWVLFPLIPIALLSPPLGSAVIFVVNVFAYVFVLIKYKINYLLLIPFIFLSGMLTNSSNGNIDGIIALGYLLPPQIGLLFILGKPQIGLGVAAFWAVEAWRQGGITKVIQTFWPVTAAYLLSFLIFGFWLQNVFDAPKSWNSAIVWPYGLLIGSVFLGLAIWKRKIEFAILASPFFSPYLGPPSWAIAFLGAFALISRIIPEKFQLRGAIKSKTAISENSKNTEE